MQLHCHPYVCVRMDVCAWMCARMDVCVCVWPGASARNASSRENALQYVSYANISPFQTGFTCFPKPFILYAFIYLWRVCVNVVKAFLSPEFLCCRLLILLHGVYLLVLTHGCFSQHILPQSTWASWLCLSMRFQPIPEIIHRSIA